MTIARKAYPKNVKMMREGAVLMIRIRRQSHGHLWRVWVRLCAVLMLTALPLLAASAFSAPIVQTLNSITYLPLVRVNNILVAHWPFDEDSTGDISGNKNDGVGIGITSTSDRFGRPNTAYQFDGMDDVITIANSPSLQIGTGDYTIAAWIKTTDTTNNGRVFSKGSWFCTTGYMMRLDGDKIHLENASGGRCLVDFNSNTSVTDGAWHFVVGVVDRDVGATIYIDGVPDATQKIDTSFADLSNERNPTIGAADERIQAPSEFFNGTIDDVRIYNAVVTPNGSVLGSEINSKHPARLAARGAAIQISPFERIRRSAEDGSK